jgi:hypothetical protein
MNEASRHRATKRKMKILAHQYLNIKVMALYFCLVMPCLYQVMKVGREQLLNYQKNYVGYSHGHH